VSKHKITRVPEYLRHILQAIERIYRYVEDADLAMFVQDEKTRDAVIRNIEIITAGRRNPSGPAFPRSAAAAPPGLPGKMVCARSHQRPPRERGSCSRP
jgi:hypothetical protein